MMLESMIPLIASFLPMFDYALWYVFGLCFLASVPFIFRYFFRR